MMRFTWGIALLLSLATQSVAGEAPDAGADEDAGVDAAVDAEVELPDAFVPSDAFLEVDAFIDLTSLALPYEDCEPGETRTDVTCLYPLAELNEDRSTSAGCTAAPGEGESAWWLMALGALPLLRRRRS